MLLQCFSVLPRSWNHHNGSVVESLQQTVNSVQQTANENVSKISQVTQSVEKAQSSADNANGKIDNLQIGGRNLIPLKMITNRGLTTFTYDKDTNTWSCIAPIGSDQWGKGIWLNPGVKKIYIPRGYTFIVSFEVNPSVACTCVVDVNNGYDNSPGTSNDNDDMSLRKTSSSNRMNVTVKILPMYL